jgi:hypothetical protein
MHRYAAVLSSCLFGLLSSGCQAGAQTRSIWKDGQPGPGISAPVIWAQSLTITTDTQVHAEDTASMHVVAPGSPNSFALSFGQPTDMSAYGEGHFLLSAQCAGDFEIEIIDASGGAIGATVMGVGFVPDATKFGDVIAPLRNFGARVNSGVDLSSVVRVSFDGFSGDTWLENIRWTSD